LIIFGIAAYAADIVFVTNIASLIEGWYIEHLSWHWIFWDSGGGYAVDGSSGVLRDATAPSEDTRLSWRGFAYFSLGLTLVYGALDQGERAGLAELRSDRRHAAGGVFLLLRHWSGACCCRIPSSISRLLQAQCRGARPFDFHVRFVLLATALLIPAFLVLFSNTGRWRPVALWPGSLAAVRRGLDLGGNRDSDALAGDSGRRTDHCRCGQLGIRPSRQLMGRKQF